MFVQQLLRFAPALGDGQKQVFGGDVVVLETTRFLAGPFEGAFEARIRGQRAALDTGALAEGRGHFAPEGGHVGTEAAQGLGRDAVVCLDQRREQVLRIEHGTLQLLGNSLGVDDGFLCLLSEAVEVHGVALMRGFGWTIWRRNSSAAAFWRPSSVAGRMTLIRAYISPAPSLLRRGIPWPLSRND